MRFSTCLLALTISLTTACGSSDKSSSDPAPPPASTPGPTSNVTRSGGTPSWLVMVYMASDERLEGSLEQELDEMSKAMAKADNLQIIVQLDRNSAGANLTIPDINGLGVFGDTRRFRITADGYVRLDTDAPLGETVTGDPAVLSRFMKDTVRDYPADHRVLLLWNHGGGPNRGIAYDDETNDGLTLRELDQALTEGLARDGDAAASLDIVAMSACWMSSLEAVSLASKHASYVVASQELMFTGFYDNKVFGMVVDDPAPRDVAVALAKSYGEGIGHPGQQKLGTIAVFDGGKVGALKAAVDDAAGALKPENLELAVPIGAARGRSYLTGFFANNAHDTQLRPFVDLGQLFSKLAYTSGPLIKQSTTPVLEALEAATVHRGNGAAMQALTGLTVYFPRDGAACDASSCEASGGYDAPGMEAWRGFLDAYATTTSSDGVAMKNPSFTNDGSQPVVTRDGNKITVEGSLTIDGASFVAGATLDIGHVDPNADGHVGLLRLTPSLDTSVSPPRLVGSFDGEVLVLTQGDQRERVFAKAVADSQADVLDVPIQITAADGKHRGGAVRVSRANGSFSYAYISIGDSGHVSWTTGLPAGSTFKVQRAYWARGDEEPTYDNGEVSFDGTRALTPALEPLPAELLLTARLTARGIRGASSTLLYETPAAQ